MDRWVDKNEAARLGDLGESWGEEKMETDERWMTRSLTNG